MHSFAWWPTVIVLCVATFTDLRSRRIPNWLVLPFLALGFVVSGWQQGWHGLGQSLEGAALALVIFVVLNLPFSLARRLGRRPSPFAAASASRPAP